MARSNPRRSIGASRERILKEEEPPRGASGYLHEPFADRSSKPLISRTIVGTPLTEAVCLRACFCGQEAEWSAKP